MVEAWKEAWNTARERYWALLKWLLAFYKTLRTFIKESGFQRWFDYGRISYAKSDFEDYWRKYLERYPRAIYVLMRDFVRNIEEAEELAKKLPYKKMEGYFKSWYAEIMKEYKKAYAVCKEAAEKAGKVKDFEEFKKEAIGGVWRAFQTMLKVTEDCMKKLNKIKKFFKR